MAATASSGLPVAYTSTTPLSNTGANYTMNSGTGTGIVRYNQAGDANYNAATEITANVVAVKAEASISLSNLSQTYDGTAKSATVTTSPMGLNGVSVTYGGSSTAPTNAGTYAVVASLSNANYQAAIATDNLMIEKASPSFTNLTASQSIVYGTSTVRLSGTINGSTVPSGTITVTINGVSQITTRGTGSNTDNFIVDFNTASLGVISSPYTITYTYPGDINFKTISDASKTLTVTKANATILLSNLSQTYDGTAKSATATTNPAGLNVVDVTYDGLATLPTNAGSYTVVASLTNDNYQATNATGTLVIGKASSSFTNLTASQSIIYSTPTITLTGKIAAGALIPAGSVSVTIDGTGGTGTIAVDGTFSLTVNTASVAVAAPYTITYSYIGSTNFNGVTNSSTTLTVNKATPVFSDLIASQAITYGTPTVTLTGKIAAGTLIPTGSVTVAFDGTSQTGVINPSDGTFSLVVNTASVAAAVTPYVITYSYAATTNFNAASNNSTSITVNKATATIVLSNLNQTYDGTAKSATATTTPAGLNVVAITYDGLTTAPTNANSYAVVASLTNSNYQATNATGTLVIGKASPSFTNLTASQSISYGASSITLTGKISEGSLIPSGLITITIDGVTATATIKQTGSANVLGNFSAIVTTSSINASVVPYIITYAYAGDDNFGTALDGNSTLTVNKANATVIVNGYTGTYDALAHGATGSATGIGGVNLNAGLSLGDTFTDYPGGTANWTFTGGTNYNNQNGSVAILVGKAATETIVTIADGPFIYLGSAQTPATVSVTGAGGLNLTPAATYANNTNAGTATAGYSYAGDANHTGSSDSKTFEISKADPTISVLGYTGIYDGDLHGATGTAKGVKEELLSGLDLGDSFANVTGGTADWVFTDATGNYNDKSGSVAIAISKADPTISVLGYTGIYDGDLHGATG
ncbi:MAG TPA: MBG domain-containing protein, partial [Prolixibacteraceae bacterium]